ncbi:iron complex transport system substrate-binding protein [Microbacterium sp. BE35]|nr:iron complex transport system substrate-binding protein [Microbacterium sp. BE35]
MRKHRGRLGAGILGLMLAVTGCTSPTTGASHVIDGADSAPVTVENCGRTVTFEAVPSRVVIMYGASVAEVTSFLSLGLEDHILANLQSYGMSDDPTMQERIDALPQAGLTVNENFDIPAEQLLAVHPDLVVSVGATGFDKSLGFATRDELQAAGANTIINPANCASGNPEATPAERDHFLTAGVDASFDLLRLLGKIFEVEDRADEVVAGMKASLADVAATLDGKTPVTGIIASPGMSMMNANGLPAVMTGGIFDDVLARSGVTNAFAGQSDQSTYTMSPEQLAAADVEILVIWGFTPEEDLDEEAAKIFADYPQWTASKDRRYVKVYDGVYFGPNNAVAVQKIARAAHPDAF